MWYMATTLWIVMNFCRSKAYVNFVEPSIRCVDFSSGKRDWTRRMSSPRSESILRLKTVRTRSRLRSFESIGWCSNRFLWHDNWRCHHDCCLKNVDSSMNWVVAHQKEKEERSSPCCKQSSFWSLVHHQRSERLNESPALTFSRGAWTLGLFFDDNHHFAIIDEKDTLQKLVDGRTVLDLFRVSKKWILFHIFH